MLNLGRYVERSTYTSLTPCLPFCLKKKTQTNEQTNKKKNAWTKYTTPPVPAKNWEVHFYCYITTPWNYNPSHVLPPPLPSFLPLFPNSSLLKHFKYTEEYIQTPSAVLTLLYNPQQLILSPMMQKKRSNNNKKKNLKKCNMQKSFARIFLFHSSLGTRSRWRVSLKCAVSCQD